jgi:hypothetical protein
MEIIDNINRLLGDNLKQTIKPGSKLKIAASFEALKKELESIEQIEFVFTSPTFVPNEVTDKIKKNVASFIFPKPNGSVAFTVAILKSSSRIN